MHRSPHADRAFVLVAVLVVTGSALLVATAALFIAQSEHVALAGAAERDRARALAWSGVQVAMNRLDRQRDDILEGGLPVLDEEYVLYERGRRRGVARLLPLDAEGNRLIPESGRLDVNSADAETLARCELVEESLARAIVKYRDTDLGRPLQSVAELLGVPGITPEILYGPIEDSELMWTLEDEGFAGSRAGSARGLADVLTVHGFEPALQRSGDLRINVNVEWTEELEQQINDRFGLGAATALKEVVESGTALDSEEAICRTTRTLSEDPKVWIDAMDAVTADADWLDFGRVDINTASYDVLMTLPGVEPEDAAQMVRVRDTLAADDRASVTWPVLQGIIEPEVFDPLAGRVTNRSWIFRVRIAAGEIDTSLADAPLENAVVMDAIIDLCGSEPRLAYLRDVTTLTTASTIALSRPASEDGEELLEPYEPDDDPEEDDPADPTADPTTISPEDAPDMSERAVDDPDPNADPAVDAGADPTAEEADDPAPASGPATPARRRVGRWRRPT